MSTPASQTPSPQELYEGLRAIVEELGRAWIVVLQRYEYMAELGRNEALHQALNQSHAAHVHNAIQDVLLLDLFRELGTLAFDDDRRSPSLRKALGRLRSTGVLNLLHEEYLRPIGVAIYGGGDSNPEIEALTREVVERADRERGEREYQALLTRIKPIEDLVFGAPQAARILEARNRGVAHYEIALEGGSWRTWRIGNTGLTYEELGDFVDRCSSAIEQMLLFVLRRNTNFADFRSVAAKYVTEYVSALAQGMAVRGRAHWM